MVIFSLLISLFTTAPEAGSREVMDIIKNSMVYDIALLYDWDQMGSRTLGEMTVSARGSYANNVANQSEISNMLQDTIEQPGKCTIFAVVS